MTDAAAGPDTRPAPLARWEHFPHGADVGVCGVAPTVAGAFEQAAVALTAIVVDPNLVRLEQCTKVECSAPDLELLLVEWLNAVIWEMTTHRMIFGFYRVAIDGSELRGEAWGEAIDVSRHQPAVEPKGATLTALRVACDPDGLWSAGCVVDV